ncbi:hypothetical protein [Bacillus halotolerans]|uniref:hypothetical protein n=1 Tax=Bacillus halotolerans TaxID=260554 RepID=UPI002DB82A8B|nr:hypothetical protein [Bacillus halotolerans]MEC1406703.1 hypothetical protein [Bacillus halotolerans]
MRFLQDFFAIWTFDKVMGYTLAAVIWFVFKSKSKQTEYHDHFEERRRHRN